ncbi:MAG: hypothetical protein OEW19_10355, partial [Acidobacteriota bacterium]|nr:hypothetical protein [Acidobacteriota bacterium]
MRGAAAAFLLGLCWTTTALAQPTASAPAGTFALRVTGGQPALDRLGLGPADRGVALIVLARALHGSSATSAGGGLHAAVTELFGTGADAPPVGEGPDAAILAPFSDRLWRRVLALDDRTDLFAAMVTNRSALLVASGALQAGPGIREWLGGEPRLLEQVVRQWPGAFALAGPALSMAGGHLLVPGGAEAQPAWSALVGAPPSQPDGFLRRLLDRDRGQLARFFANLARMRQARRAALLAPVRGEDDRAALEAMYQLARDAEAPWEPNRRPFQLSYADLPAILLALDDLPIDALPDSAGWWPPLLATRIDSRAEALSLLQRPPAAPAFAETIRRMLSGAPRRRRTHITTIALARRIWDGAAGRETQADAVYALGQFERFPALLLTLDRLDVTTPAIWATAVDAARRVDNGGGSERERTLGLFQGALALVERARLAGSLSALEAGRVIESLVTPVASGTEVDRAVREWMLGVFVPALPPLVRPDRYSGRTAYESRVLQALAGRPLDAPPPLSWEGQAYVVDVAAGEHERILRIRALLPSPGLDAALEGGDPDALVAALRALVYAPALGDPDGAVSLGPDVVTRHDFGIGVRSAGREFAWAPAQERTGAGAPWHVAGSLFGLDLALARSALRRLSSDEMPPVPTVNLNDQLTLAHTAVALKARDMDDRVRDELAAAIARGRARVAAAGTDVTLLMALGDETALTVGARRTLAWTVAQAPGSPASLFSLRDLAWLGRPALTLEELASWGVVSDSVDGRSRTRFHAPVPWDELAGRPDTGVLATQVPDLALRLAEATARKHVPAALIPALLLYATQDYWHEVEARFVDDWPAMVRGAAALPDTRIEDYIAALGSGGPLR